MPSHLKALLLGVGRDHAAFMKERQDTTGLGRKLTQSGYKNCHALSKIADGRSVLRTGQFSLSRPSSAKADKQPEAP